MRALWITPLAVGVGTFVWARHRSQQIAGWHDAAWQAPDAATRWQPLDIDEAIAGAAEWNADMLAELRKDSVALENTNRVIYNAHPADRCLGENCTLHNRSNHHMREWPQHWREDRMLMERICPHGVGHPDPDEIAIDHTHGCDGCCATYEELGMDAPADDGMRTEITVIDGQDGFTPDMLRWRKPVVLVDWNSMNGNTIDTIYDRGLQKGDSVRLTDFEEDELDCIGVVVDMREPNVKSLGDVMVYTFEVRR